MNCENIGNNIVLLGALIAITLAKDLTISEQDLLGNFLQVVAQNLLSMAATKNDCETITLLDKNSTLEKVQDYEKQTF